MEKDSNCLSFDNQNHKVIVSNCYPEYKEAKRTKKLWIIQTRWDWWTVKRGRMDKRLGGQ